MLPAEVLKHVRLQKGFSKAKLAELTGLSERTIFSYESQERNMTAYSIIELSRALGITADQLLGLKPLIESNMYDEVEEHKNCTVQILHNTITGEYSFGWWKNKEED